MRILIRTSRTAIWARRFGSLALPLTIIPVFMHREGAIESQTFAIVEGVAAAVALLGLLLACTAFASLWISGHQGWWKAALGFLFSTICLVPFALVGYLMWHYPAVSDISTDFDNPPLLSSTVPQRFIVPELRERIEAAFPNARTRTYPIDAVQLFGIVSQMVEDQGWEIRVSQAPQTALDQGQINAVVTTLLGWRDEVSIRIQGEPEGAVVAMRSAGLHELHDLGENGRTVEQFLLQLDDSITTMLRSAPQPAATTEEPATSPDDAAATSDEPAE